jgi:tRNA pseudouridine55 synthase
MDGLDGVLVVDKPAGPTSHDMVDRVRRAFGLRRVGHTGTLDPFATGVLPVCLGKATRLARFLSAGDKVYRATLRLGFATTTDDATGEPLGAPGPGRVERGAIEAALAALRGALAQVPPVYSAKQVGGWRLYELARRGETPERAAVAVVVHEIEIVEAQGELVELHVRCSPGTYVRALARDLGASLGVGAHLTALRRLRSGDFGLPGSEPGDALSPASRAKVVPLSALLPTMPAARVDERGRDAVRHGRELHRDIVLSGFPATLPERVRILDEQDHLLALAVGRGFGRGTPGLPMEPSLHPDVVLVD